MNKLISLGIVSKDTRGAFINNDAEDSGAVQYVCLINGVETPGYFSSSDSRNAQSLANCTQVP